MTTIPDSESRFSYKSTKDGQVFIYRDKKHAKTLKGHAGTKLLGKLARLDIKEAQLLMARETGQFKFGNEKKNNS